MTKASRSQAIDSSFMNLIANRIYNRMQKLGLTQTELSERASIEGAHLSDFEERPSLSRERISRILMNRHAMPNQNAARSLSLGEFRILALALKVSVEWLRGDGLDEDGVLWNVLAERERADHFLHLLEEYEDRADKSLVWSEYPLFPFTTGEFMTSFHRAHFGKADAFGRTKDKSRLVEFFNKVGNARRQSILKPKRTFSFTNFICRSELEQMADGEGVYRAITASVRKRCFEHIVKVLTDQTLRMDLVILHEETIGDVQAALRDYETVWVIGESLSLWNYHSGTIGWTEHPRRVKYHRELLDEMRRRTNHKGMTETINQINKLLSRL